MKITRYLKYFEDPKTVLHFGVRLRNKPDGLKLTFDNYLPEKYRRVDCAYSIYENFHLNMKYFRTLNHDDFNAQLLDFVQKYHFAEIDNLNAVAGIDCNYIMVLDDYCQAYIGATSDIKTKIMTHWRKSGPTGYLFWSVDDSILSIDSFRALDTTRIFYYKTDIPFIWEEELVSEFPSKYRLNRTAGGLLSEGFLDACYNILNRDMSQFKDIKVSILKEKGKKDVRMFVPIEKAMKWGRKK